MDIFKRVNRPSKSQRRKIIMSSLPGRFSFSELATKFGVTEQVVRRDFKELGITIRKEAGV